MLAAQVTAQSCLFPSWTLPLMVDWRDRPTQGGTGLERQVGELCPYLWAVQGGKRCQEKDKSNQPDSGLDGRVDSWGTPFTASQV